MLEVGVQLAIPRHEGRHALSPVPSVYHRQKLEQLAALESLAAVPE